MYGNANHRLLLQTAADDSSRLVHIVTSRSRVSFRSRNRPKKLRLIIGK